MPARALPALATFVLLVLATVATALPASSATTSAEASRAAVTRGTGTGDFESATVLEINRVRSEHGLRPIQRVLPCLDRLSEGWGRRMMVEGLWEHRDLSSVTRACRLSWTGETLARGSLTPETLVNMWMNSPPHREILLTGQARLAGIDVRRGPTGQYSAVLNLGDRD